MKYDKPLLAMLIGILGGIPVEIYTQLMKYFQLTTVSAAESISMMWMEEGSWLIGGLGVIGFGSWVGLIIYYGTKILGADYLIIKAIILTMTAESLLFNIFGTLGKNPYLIQDQSGNLVHASAAAIGGLSVGFLMKKYLVIETAPGKGTRINRYFILYDPAAKRFPPEKEVLISGKPDKGLVQDLNNKLEKHK